MPKIKGDYCERSEKPRRSFDRRSFRWIKRGKAWLLIGCPRGSWKPRTGRCSVGTKAYKVLVPSRGRCRLGKKVKKG